MDSFQKLDFTHQLGSTDILTCGFLNCVRLPHQSQHHSKRWNDNSKRLLQQIASKEKITTTPSSTLYPIQYDSQSLSLDSLESVLQEVTSQPLILTNLRAALSPTSSSYSEGFQLHFLNVLIPFMAETALRIESLFPDCLGILTSSQMRHELAKSSESNQQSCSIRLSKEQIFCIICHMFFMTLSERELKQPLEPAERFPSHVNMQILLTETKGEFENACNIQKLLCLFTYIDRMHILSTSPRNESTGVNEFTDCYVIFSRNAIAASDSIENNDALTSQSSSHIGLSKMTIAKPDEQIESFQNQFECIQSDFADKFVGGGVLKAGCAQEEIMFIKSPELLVSILLASELQANEAILVSGAEQFSSSVGFRETFKFSDSFKNTTIPVRINQDSKDAFKPTHYAIFDAKDFRKSQKKHQEGGSSMISEVSDEFSMENLMREKKKLTAAFSFEFPADRYSKENRNNLSFSRIPVITGNWGCGVFAGNPQLKFILQWIVASEFRRNVVYCAFKEPKLDRAQEIITKLTLSSVTTEQTMKILLEYAESKREYDLFSFILSHSSDQSCDKNPESNLLKRSAL